MSLLGLALPAVRPRMPARVLISGAAGLGPLLTGLDLAERLGGRVTVIDAGDGESLELAGIHEFDVVHRTAPFAVDPLVEALRTATGPLVVHNLSAWWTGPGGLSDVGHTVSWDAANAAVSRLVRAVRFSPAHVVATVRARMRVHVDVVDGVEHPRLVGESMTLQDDIARAFSVIARTDSELNLWVLATAIDSLGVGQTDALHEALVEWHDEGGEVLDRETVAELVAPVAQLRDKAARAAIRTDFRASFGPGFIPAAHLDAAREFIARHTTKETP